MEFVLACRMVAVIIIGWFEKENVNPSPEAIRAIVDKLIDAFIKVEDAIEDHNKTGCILTLDADSTHVRALIDCYTMEMAYIEVSIEGQKFRMEYMIVEGEILSNVTYNSKKIL